MSSSFDLAVLGADDPLGEAVLKLLEEREVPVGHLYALTLDEEEGAVHFRGRDWPCHQAEGFDFSRIQALLATSGSSAATRLLKQVGERYPAMPISGPEDIMPAPALAVSRLLKPLAALTSLESAEAFCALPVSVAGKVGVEELANQSRSLFNMESPDPEVFPLQVAFNLIPLGGTPDSVGYGARLAESNRRIAGGPRVGYSVVWAPVFYGAAIFLHVLGKNAVDISALRNNLVHVDGVTLMETDLPGGVPTPATDAAESDDVFVGQIMVEGNRMRFWLVLDPMRLEAAQIVSVVENWIDKPANSVLT